MVPIAEVLLDEKSPLQFDFDENSGCDGARFRITADVEGFRTLATILNQIADTVDDPDHSSHDVGWHVGLNSEDFPMLELTNARILNLNCRPTER